MHLHVYGVVSGVNVDVSASMTGNIRDLSAGPSSDATRAWIRLMRAQRLVLSAIEQDLKRASLPPLGWYDVLLELVRVNEGRLRPYEIEERTLLAQHNLSRLLDRMERDGLLRRESFADDGRGRWVVITDDGRSMQARIWSVYGVSIQKHVGAKLNEKDAAHLGDLLAKLCR